MFIMESSSKQLVKENPSGIQYFTCWSEHMKHSDMVLFEGTIKTANFARNWTHPQSQESVTLTMTIFPVNQGPGRQQVETQDWTE